MATTPPSDERQPVGLTGAEAWRAVARASFAVVSYVTPSGDPRSVGVVFTTVGGRLYAATAPDSWKARHIAAAGRVAVTVPVRRGGVLALVLPIPPATVSFHGSAVVHAPGSSRARELTAALGSLLPDDRRDSSVIIEVTPEDAFVTYGIGVSLSAMRDPAAAAARVPVA